MFVQLQFECNRSMIVVTLTAGLGLKQVDADADGKR